MGMLTEKGPPLWHPSDSASRETAREAVEYCKVSSTTWLIFSSI